MFIYRAVCAPRYGQNEWFVSELGVMVLRVPGFRGAIQIDALRWAWRISVRTFFTISMTCRVILLALPDPHRLKNAIDLSCDTRLRRLPQQPQQDFLA